MGVNHDRKPLKDFLMRVFLVFRNLVKQEVYPPDWLVIKMVANNVMLKSLQELAQPLAFKFLDSRIGYIDKEVRKPQLPNVLPLIPLLPAVDELLQPRRGLLDSATAATGAVFRSEAREDHREIRRHARLDGFPDFVHVVPTRWAQTAFHSIDGGSFLGSDAGTGDRAAQSHIAHLFRHDGVRAKSARKFQTSRERVDWQAGHFGVTK